MMALTADSRGRLVFHNVSGYLSLTAMLAGATSFIGSAIPQQLQAWKGSLHPSASQRHLCIGCPSLQKQAGCAVLHCCHAVRAGCLVLL